MQVAITGDPISAERAHTLGLVNDLVEPGQVVEAALALARRICANAPIAVRESSIIVRAGLEKSDDELWDMTARAMRRVSETEDFAEGPRAFIDKRDPVWKGR